MSSPASRDVCAPTIRVAEESVGQKHCGSDAAEPRSFAMVVVVSSGEQLPSVSPMPARLLGLTSNSRVIVVPSAAMTARTSCVAAPAGTGGGGDGGGGEGGGDGGGGDGGRL
eukprot:6149606-Prymnesium_polylepis.1